MEGYGGATTDAPGDSFFSSLNPFDQFGITGAMPAPNGSTEIPGIARSTGPGGANQVTPPLWSPRNPMFVFGVLLAATVGLVGFSTSFGVRAGKQRARATVSVGKA